MRNDPLNFFDRLKWLDEKPLQIEPYRRRIFSQALSTIDEMGWTPRYNLVVTGRGKKNFKSLDLILVGLFKLLVQVSQKGNQCYILANDADQAGDDLDLAKKIIAVNPVIAKRVAVKRESIDRKDGGGFLKILPAGDVIGSHGKTYLWAGFDEIHGYRNWDIFEALALDPHRPEASQWITSYDSLIKQPGIPLFDMIQKGKAGSDPKMFFSWYAGDYCTDPEYGSKETQEERANPSTLPAGYLDQQKRRLPSHKYRRLHLNIGGQPEGAYLSAEIVEAAIRKGSRRLSYRPEFSYVAFVDMSGGSADDATLGISHKEDDLIIVDGVWTQGRKPPFDPRSAVNLFVSILESYGIKKVTGDRYAGETFRRDFQGKGISYEVCPVPKSVLYEHLEVGLNSGSSSLPDEPELSNQLLILVMRGVKIDHPPGEHDDLANAAAGAVWLLSGKQRPRWRPVDLEERDDPQDLPRPVKEAFIIEESGRMIPVD